MRIKIFGSVLLMVLGLAVSTVVAAPQADKPGCGKKAAATASKPADDGRSECGGSVQGGCGQSCDKPCCGKAVTTTADPAPGDCPCGKSCGGKGKGECGGKGTATTVADTASGGCPCGKSCGGKCKGDCAGKAGESCCGGCPGSCGGKCDGACGCKGAATASDKGETGCGGSCDKPCGSKEATTVADTGKAGCAQSCGGCPNAASKDGGCPMAAKAEATLASAPSMKYRVGDEVTGCPKSAAALSEKTGKPIEYVVGDQAVADKGDALMKLAGMLENEARMLQTVQFIVDGTAYGCPTKAKTASQESDTTVTYRVGGVDFDNQEDAELALAAIHDALVSLKMKYRVGDDTFCCSQTASAKAKEAGQNMTYVIGDNETPCEKTAQLMLTQAKLRTIVSTAAKFASPLSTS